MYRNPQLSTPLMRCFLLLIVVVQYFSSGFRLTNFVHNSQLVLIPHAKLRMKTDAAPVSIRTVDAQNRKELWIKVSGLEKKAVELLCEGSDESTEEACRLFAESTGLKSKDPFVQLATEYSSLKTDSAEDKGKGLLREMRRVGVPPHIDQLAARQIKQALAVSEQDSADNEDGNFVGIMEDVDLGSTFSDTVTDKVRVKVSSFFDSEKSDPENGKYMFYYKVNVFNEGPEPVQIVARMWEIEKCRGEKEVVRGAGILNTQPIISPGDMFAYQSACPLKVFPPKGTRILGSMSGAYTMCKGNMGQHNFTVKISKFNLILPESVASS